MYFVLVENGDGVAVGNAYDPPLDVGGMRAERSNAMDGYFSPVCYAIESGALGLVAGRIESDQNSYD